MARPMSDKVVAGKIAAFRPKPPRIDVGHIGLFPDLIDALRNRMPVKYPDYQQVVGHAGPYTTVDNTDEYVEITVEDASTEYGAVKAWWRKFEQYLCERGGQTIIWRFYPEHYTKTSFDKTAHRIYARLFVERVLPAISFPLVLPRMTIESANALREHVEVYHRLLREYEGEPGYSWLTEYLKGRSR